MNSGQTYSLPLPLPLPRVDYYALLSIAAYLAFVWGMVVVRHDYMWIIGDDPNLVNQALLLSKGLLPNIDFVSGYPGLGLYPHALLIHLLGPTPLSEHVDTAILASISGIVFIWVLRQYYDSGLLAGVLLLIYFNSHFNNPSPNPGYGFEIFFIVGLLCVYKGIEAGIKWRLLIGGAVAFSVAASFKQYGIFAPVAYLALSSFFLFNSAKFTKGMNAQTLIVLIVNAIPLILFLFVYVKGMVFTPGVVDYRLALNLLAFGIPWLMMSMLMAFGWRGVATNMSFRDFLLSNASFATVFALASVLIMYAMYGNLSVVGQALHIIYFEAPKKINQLIVYIHPLALLSTAALALLISFFPLIFESVRSGKFGLVHPALLLIMALAFGYLIRVQMNVGGSLYFPAFPIIVIAAYHFLGRKSPKIFLFLSIQPLLLILTPFPDYAYHLLLFLLIGLWALAPEGERRPAELRPWIKPAMLGLMACLFGVTLLKSERFINRATHEYDLRKDMTMRSGDIRWEAEIETAHKILDGQPLKCANHACVYVVNLSKYDGK